MKPDLEDLTASQHDSTRTVGGGVAPRAAPTLPALPGRYEDLGPIAGGSFGEVRRVRDMLLDRVVAMKLLRAEHAGVAHLRRRFLVEAQITAGLQHPGIVAVYDRGELEDGRLWFTMKEVRGRTMKEVIAELHAAKTPQGFATTPAGWTFRRVVDAFARIAQAIAYAHSRGVVHRDLKPDNLMAGEFGEVLVMDWGLARRAGIADENGRNEGASWSSPELTRHGDILGTPAYMSPEQARGEAALHGPASDVYALGAVLHCLLTGQAPYRGTVSEVLAAILAGVPARVREAAAGGPPLPEELVALCERARSPRIEDRPESAEALAAEIVAWLDGVRRREQALAALDQARALDPEIAALRAQAEEARARARALKSDLRSYDRVEKKRPAWLLEDEAARLGRAAAIAETKWMEAVQGALSLDPDLPEAHAALADHYQARLVEAEVAHRDEDAARAEELLRAHDRGRHAAFLRGDGALTLSTDPPGAEVTLYRYVERSRRLVPELVEDLGPTPLVERALPRGSYLLKVRAPGFVELSYPVLIERGQHASGVRPGGLLPHPIPLLRAGEIGPDEVYIPAGWFLAGGDPDAGEGLPRRKLWVDGFLVQRHPVTNEHYLAFLNALMASGREAEALAACPRMPLGRSAVAGGELRYVRGEDGRFLLGTIQADVQETPQMPVAFVDWWGATQFAAWLAATSGKPYRLPDELEWEKAARGVDGRFLPWGDFHEPTWACMKGSHAGVQGRVPVEDYPTDESPYGVRGTAGNVRDWCKNAWTLDGPRAEGDLVRLDEVEEPSPEFRSARGGTWAGSPFTCRLAARMAGQPNERFGGLGFRLARSRP